LVSLSALSNYGIAATPAANAGTSLAEGLSESGPATKVPRQYETDALLFNGEGTWAAEVESLRDILNSNHTTFKEVNSAELDAMTVDDISKFGLIIWPGGLGGTQTSSLSSQTQANLRAAVQDKGVSFLGFCAGSFVAVAPKPEKGKDASYGLGIVNGTELDYYYLEHEGEEADMVMASFADGSKRDLVWYGGPVTPNFPEGVVAKYPNGDPMMSEVWAGNGFVLMSAVHPTAPQGIRDDYGLKDSDGLDYELTQKLIQSALHQQPLPAFS
jgi:glutamine amidotransferase-like uncharacterized protein